MTNGWRLDALGLLLTLRIIRVITCVISVDVGSIKTTLPWTTLSLVLERRIYDMYSPTWPPLMGRATRPREAGLSINNPNGRNPPTH